MKKYFLTLITLISLPFSQLNGEYERELLVGAICVFTLGAGYGIYSYCTSKPNNSNQNKTLLEIAADNTDEQFLQLLHKPSAPSSENNLDIVHQPTNTQHGKEQNLLDDLKEELFNNSNTSDKITNEIEQPIITQKTNTEQIKDILTNVGKELTNAFKRQSSDKLLKELS